MEVKIENVKFIFCPVGFVGNTVCVVTVVVGDNDSRQSMK